MGAWRTGVGAFCALVLAVILVCDPAFATSEFRGNEELGENCKFLKQQSVECIENARTKFMKSMENTHTSDICTNKVCDNLNAIEECYTHLEFCENEEENKKEIFKEIILNGDCKSLNTEICPIMKVWFKSLMVQKAEEDGDEDDANDGNQDRDAALEIINGVEVEEIIADAQGCEEGYGRDRPFERCDICSENFYGHPEQPEGKCQPCDCSHNTNTSDDITGNCDHHTGECLQCLFHTEGWNCDICEAGYYGDAINSQCQECQCSLLGTDRIWDRIACDPYTGACRCLPNVEGHNCDSCIAYHWRIGSGKGCEPCSCDPIGSTNTTCDLFTGQCTCKPGFGGYRCDHFINLDALDLGSSYDDVNDAPMDYDEGVDVVTDVVKMDDLDLGSGYEDVSDEPMDSGISLGVEEILLEARLEQLEKENANLRKNIQMKDTQLLNMQNLENIIEIITQQNTENMKENENLLSVTIQKLKNITTYAEHLKSQLDTELQLKSIYQEDAQLERQMHEITKQELADSRNMIQVSMKFTKLLVGHISQLENMTDPVDMRSTIHQMKKKETLYMAENLAYQNEILLLRNLTTNVRDQNENLINSMTQQGKLDKLKERMMNILHSSLMEMARAIPNCTTITTQELEAQLDAVLEEEDPLKQLLSQCSIFNQTSANLQHLYAQHNTLLKEQLATKMDVINLHIGENRELNDALEETKQLANIQSQSLKLLAAEMDRLLPNGITRVQRNADGKIESVYLCQCIPEAPKASELKISAIQWTCPEDKAVNHQLENTFTHTCSEDSDCSVGSSSWPQCGDVFEKSWSGWEYFDCTEVDIGSETILCGNGNRSRSRDVKFDWFHNSWRSEDVWEQCEQCSLSVDSARAFTFSPPALETALKAVMDAANRVCLTSDGWVEFGHSCYKRFGYQDSLKNDWESARLYCMGLDADLASIHSYEENRFIKRMIRDDAWIGYTDKYSGFYEWSDRSARDYTNWYSGQPNQPSEHPIVIDTNGEWWDRDESNIYQFVCKFQV